MDHVREYRRPKDADGNEIIEKGCAPVTPPSSPSPSPEPAPPLAQTTTAAKAKKKKKEKKAKKDKGKKKRQRRRFHSHSPESEDYSGDEPPLSPAEEKDLTASAKLHRRQRYHSPPSSGSDDGTQRKRPRHSDGKRGSRLGTREEETPTAAHHSPRYRRERRQEYHDHSSRGCDHSLRDRGEGRHRDEQGKKERWHDSRSGQSRP